MVVVVVIIGAIASFAIPSYSRHIEKIRSSEGVQSLTSLLAAQKRYQFENGAYATLIAQLDISIAASNNFNVPTVSNAAAAVASITRSDANIPYQLSISDAGVVSCACAACSPAAICTQLGY